MEKIVCDVCKKEIKSNKDFIAVMQCFPKFPYSKFHSSCYSTFLKNRFLVITPKGGSGVISGKNGTRGTIIAVCIFIFFIAFLFFGVYPKIPHTTVANISILVFILIGLILLATTVLLRVYIYYKFEKKLA